MFNLRSRNWFFMLTVKIDLHMKLGSPAEVSQECWCSSSLFNMSFLFLLYHPEENVKTESQILQLQCLSLFPVYPRS